MTPSEICNALYMTNCEHRQMCHIHVHCTSVLILLVLWLSTYLKPWADYTCTTNFLGVNFNLVSVLKKARFMKIAVINTPAEDIASWPGNQHSECVARTSIDLDSGLTGHVPQTVLRVSFDLESVLKGPLLLK